MGVTITVKALLDKVSLALNDDKTRYPDSVLVPWLNTVRREIISLKPDVNTSNIVQPLVAGTLQTLASGVVVIAAIRNMGLAGAVVGSAIGTLEKDTIDAQIPDWHTDTANGEVIFIIPDTAPGRFFVYPPQPVAPTSVALTVAVVPADTAIATYATDLVGFDDFYEPAIINGVAYWALSQEKENAALAAKANAFQAAYFMGLGLQTKG